MSFHVRQEGHGINTQEEKRRTVQNGRLSIRSRRSDRDPGVIDISEPRSIPVGWKEKNSSKKSHADFGGDQSSNRKFVLGRGKKGGDKDGKDRDTGGNGEGGGGNEPPNGNAKGKNAAMIPREDEFEGESEFNLDGFRDRKLLGSTFYHSLADAPNVAPPGPRHASSLFSHEYEDELRKRMRIEAAIKSEFLQTQDETRKENRLVEEQGRRISWDTFYHAKERARKSLDLRPPGLPYQNDSAVDCWMWGLRSRLKTDPVPPKDLLNLPNSVRFCRVYQKCFRWEASDGSRKILWESDLIQSETPVVYSSFPLAGEPRKDNDIRSPALTEAYFRYRTDRALDGPVDDSRKVLVAQNELVRRQKEREIARTQERRQLPSPLSWSRRSDNNDPKWTSTDSQCRWLCVPSRLKIFQSEAPQSAHSIPPSPSPRFSRHSRSSASSFSSSSSMKKGKKVQHMILINDTKGIWNFVEAYPDTVYVWGSGVVPVDHELLGKGKQIIGQTSNQPAAEAE